MYRVVLKKGKERKILNGYPWVFANEVLKIDGKDVQGSVARVEDVNGKFVGLDHKIPLGTAGNGITLTQAAGLK